MAQNESPYMVSYMLVIQTNTLSCIVLEISAKKQILLSQHICNNSLLDGHFKSDQKITRRASTPNDGLMSCQAKINFIQ